MPTTIQIGNRTATIKEGLWKSEDKRLAQELQADTNPRGASAEYPDSDYGLAVEVAEKWGGKVVLNDAAPSYVEGVDY